MPNKEFFVQNGLKVKGNTLLNGVNYSHSPLAKLHVKTAANGVGSNLNNVNGIIIENSGTSNSNYALKLATGSGNIFNVTNAGNVGIGVTTPNVELTVVGDISATGSLYGNIEDLSFDTITITGDLNVGGTVFTDALSAGTEIESPEFIGNLRGAVSFKGQAGEALTKGDVVYISGISGNTTVVSKADADDPSKMPAFGIASESASLNTSVTIINFGAVTNLDTSAFPEGTELFVGTTAGVLVSAAPTGENSAIQKMAKVTRQDASVGSITVMGAGRSNAVPNLNEGRLFVGNSSNQAVADDTLFVDIADSKVGIGTTDPTYKLDVSGDGRFTSDILVNELTIGKGGGNVSTNTALGVNALCSNTTGSQNVAISFNSLQNNTSGSCNIATGSYSLYFNTTGCYNIATGFSSLRCNTTGSCNIATGFQSLYCNVSGSDNIATGNLSLRYNTTGSYNIATGPNSLRCNTTGSCNVAIGTCSLYCNTTCCNNTAIGYGALKFNTSPNNTAIGSSSLCSLNCNLAAGNTAIGMGSICKNTSGQRNTGIGLGVLLNSTTGSNNVGLGAYAGDTLTTGSDNIIIGYNADVAATDSNSIVIGCGATGLGSNSIVIGNNSITKTCINSTRVGIGTDPAATFHVDGSSTSSYGLFTYNGINNAILGFFAGQTYSALYWKNNTCFRLGTSTGITGAGFSEKMVFNTSNVVFNELGNDIDFRVEAQSTSPGPLGNKAYALFVDAASGAVGIGTSQPGYALEVNGTAHVTGTFTAGTKSFLIDHPTKENYLLQYGSLEGPENGVYVRGTSTSSTIILPDYWRGLVDEYSITVTLTPRGKFLPLYIEDIQDYIIHVSGTEIGSLYDYVVYGTRKDVDDLLVEFERPTRSS